MDDQDATIILSDSQSPDAGWVRCPMAVDCLHNLWPVVDHRREHRIVSASPWDPREDDARQSQGAVKQRGLLGRLYGHVAEHTEQPQLLAHRLECPAHLGGPDPLLPQRLQAALERRVAGAQPRPHRPRRVRALLEAVQHLAHHGRRVGARADVGQHQLERRGAAQGHALVVPRGGEKQVEGLQQQAVGQQLQEGLQQLRGEADVAVRAEDCRADVEAAADLALRRAVGGLGGLVDQLAPGRGLFGGRKVEDWVIERRWK